MARVKRGVIARARHKKVLKQAKGYYGASPSRMSQLKLSWKKFMRNLMKVIRG